MSAVSDATEPNQVTRAPLASGSDSGNGPRRATSSARAWLAAVVSFGARQPFATAYALLLLIVGFVAGPILGQHRAIRGVLGTGYDSVVDHGRWWSPVTSVFVVDGVIELVFAVLAAVVVLGFAERLDAGAFQQQQ